MLNSLIQKKIGIVGLGNMGIGLLRLFLKRKFTIIALTRSKKLLDDLNHKYDSYIQSGVLTLSHELESLQKADIVIEAISENFECKRDLYIALSNMVSSDCILCSNTSSLSILELSQYVKCSSRFLGVHFFNPPFLIEAAEIVPHPETSKESIDLISNIIQSINYKSEIVQDTPGFLVNRLLFSLIVQAIKYYEENHRVSPKSVDIMMESACNFKMGPLKTADLIGLDNCLTILKNLESRVLGNVYTPPKLLEDFVSKGYLGKKSGKGFYEYN